jgi:ATP-dependent Clp protease ATP-binding subunit ClpA
MYERLTDRARNVLELANQEAQRFHHHYIGTEHILLGLVSAGDGVAANVLQNLHIDLGRARQEVEKIVQSGPDRVSVGKLPQTPWATKVLEHSIEEARNLNHDYVGTEHLLLGLLREQEGVAAQVLMNLGLRLEIVREEFERLLGSVPGEKSSRLPGPPWRWEPEVPDLPLDALQVVQELDARIEQLNHEKVVAIAEHDFETAAHNRDRTEKLKKERTDILAGWHTRFVVDPAWLSWNGGAVARIAGEIHQERRWQELPVLADALEEAGCTNAELLAHCRQGAGHALRCWVVDLLLGKV